MQHEGRPSITLLCPILLTPPSPHLYQKPFSHVCMCPAMPAWRPSLVSAQGDLSKATHSQEKEGSLGHNTAR